MLHNNSARKEMSVPGSCLFLPSEEVAITLHADGFTTVHCFCCLFLPSEEVAITLHAGGFTTVPCFCFGYE